MTWVAAGTAAVNIGSSLYSGSKAKKAAKKASAAQARAAEAAAARQREAGRQANVMQTDIYNRNVGLQQPYIQTGRGANAALNQALGFGDTGDPTVDTPARQYAGRLSGTFSADDLYDDPSYQFRLDQGRKQLEASSAARGGLLSAQGQRDLSDYAQNTASKEYQSAFDRFNTNQTNLYNRLTGVAGAGAGAANNLGILGGNYATSYGQNLMAGETAASGYLTDAASAKSAGILGQAGAQQNMIGAAGNFIKDMPWGSLYDKASGYISPQAGLEEEQQAGVQSGVGRSAPNTGGFDFSYKN